MAPGRIDLPSTPSRETKTNGVNGVHGSPSTTMCSPVYKSTSYSYRSSSTNGSADSAVTYLIDEAARALEKKGASDLGFSVFESISGTTFVGLVQYIGNERLSSLPHKGSKWDKVLIRALYFAERQHAFEKMMKAFGAEENAAANFAYGYCKLLLELGHENADALDKALSILYKYSLEVAALLHRAEILSTNGQIREQLCLMYSDLLTLTSVVATRFYKTAQGTEKRTSLDVYEICGDVIESFHDRQTKVADLIWTNQANLAGVDLDRKVMPKILSRWLAPIDQVQGTLTKDHTIQLAGQAEFTNLWFQKSLSTFAQSDSRIMAVTGQPGSGKTVLAASIAERLQRTLGRKSFSTLFYSISSETPAACTVVSVLKSLLAQVFDLRLGNVQTYYAVARAYENCQLCTDVKRYENHLWDALDEAFKRPLENARDLIVIVDGLDEIEGGKAAAQAFFERLADTVCDGKRVKLIGLADSLSMPSGINTTHIQVSHDNVHDDIHAVLLRNLMHSRALHSKPGPEQEQILERLARASNGSFLWAILVSELLSTSKSPEELSKTLDEVEKSKPSVSDLVSRLVLRHELSTTARTIVGWINSAERPLGVSDAQKLLSGGKPSSHDSDSDIHTALHPLESLLSFNDNIIRFKHRHIHQSISSLVESGKINIPSEDKGADIVVRALRYALSVLKDDCDPSLEEYDLDTIERIFKEHTLLPYTVRYWVVHLQRLGTSKYPRELSTVLSNAAVLSQIERTVWNHELPLLQTLELHKTAAHVRQSYLKQPNAAVLQTSINTALIYDVLGRNSEAAPIYYSCTQTSHSLTFEQLTIELTQHFLRASNDMIERKRTEITTRREDVYKVLLLLFERQYGVTSSEVIHIRTMLAQLYEHIQETQNASAVYEIIHKQETETYGRDSTQARSTSEKLRVSLGRTQSQEKIETRKESIFDEEDEVETEDTLDITRVSQLLQAAKTERAFVDLWQRVSAICQVSSSVEMHEKNIEIATAYSRFLVNQKRSEEAAATLCCVSKEYERNAMTFSDRIVSQLSQTASFLQELGQYAASLSILRSVSQIYSSLQREESHRSREIQSQITTVETQLIERSSTGSHGDILERVFRSAIKNEKPVDAKLMSIAKTLATQYMEHYQPADAVEIITLLFSRVWPSFLNASINEVEMTSTFPKETIELVLEFLVPCYRQQRQAEKVERTLATLFNAVLTTQSVDFDLVNKIQALLVEHYDKQNHAEKSIETLQKALPVRRSTLGTNHDTTIKTLYDIGKRSRERPRAYPGWIDFYQQIVSYLNKDSETCHPKALDALIIVATTYWEDGRYDAAVHNYTILWNTFVKKPKEFAQFNSSDFAERLYERYYRCLESTSVKQETLLQITEQYRSTCITIFGAQSEVTVRATLALARICHSSEKHESRALDLYEDVSKNSQGGAVYKAEIQSALHVLYTRQVMTQSTSVKSEKIESARVRSVEQYQSSINKFGYTHQSTLSSLHQVALLYYKQGNGSAIIKELTKATTEIITKETSSIKLIESAESIVSTFRSTSNIQYCQQLITELHRQIVCKDASRSSSSGFELTRYGRSTLPFLAAMMYRLSSESTVSFAQIMANLTLEMSLFEEYRKIVKSSASLQEILTSASALRVFLLRIKRNDAVAALDKEVASIFVSRDGSKMKLLSQDSAQILMTAIMEYLGTHKRTTFIKAVVLASNERLVKLMSSEQYKEAYDIANCAFEFALENEGYHGKGISHGFSLASNLAGVGYTKKCQDANLRKQMLQLSNGIAKQILEVCKQQKTNFTQIQLHELNRLVELLGVQEDYETLEWLLTTLWSTREAHRDWEASTLHNLGRQLVCARYLAGHPIKALRLCEDIAYNLRRTHGATHQITRDMNVLLAQLYTSCGNYYLQQGTKDKNNNDIANQYFAKALAVHEEMLRLLVSDGADGAMDDDDDYDSTGAILAEHGISLKLEANGHANGGTDEASMAKTHLRLLKLAYQRLGYWPRSHDEYERLVGQVQSTFTSAKDIQTPDKWQVKGYGSGKAESQEGTFEKVESWRLMDA